MPTRFDDLFSEIYAVIEAGDKEHREHFRDLDDLTIRFVFDAARKEASGRGWISATKPRDKPDDLHEISFSRRDSFSRCGITAVLKIGRRPGVHLAAIRIRFHDSKCWNPVSHVWTFDSLPRSMPLRLSGVSGGVDAVDTDEQRVFVTAVDDAVKKRSDHASLKA